MKLLRNITSTLLALLVLATSVQAGWTFGTTTSSNAVSVATTGQLITEIQVTDTSGSANTLTVYDNNTAATTRAKKAYVTRAAYTTNVVSTYTDPAGVSTSVTNTVLYTYAVTNAAVTNAATIVYKITVPANGTVYWNPETPQGTTLGVTLYSVGATSYAIQLLPLP